MEWLINHGKKNPDLTSKVYTIASLLQSLVTNKRTGFQVLMTMLVLYMDYIGVNNLLISVRNLVLVFLIKTLKIC